MTVVDASTIVAALLDGGAHGTWAQEVLVDGDLAAPHLLPVEVADILRRAALSGYVSADAATLAHADLDGLGIELLPYEPLAERVWDLRGDLTAYDAWYVSLAEWLEVPLATLDRRLTRSPGPRCEFVVPPAG